MSKYKLIVGKPGVHVKLAGFGSFRTPFSLVIDSKKKSEEVKKIIETIYRLEVNVQKMEVLKEATSKNYKDVVKKENVEQPKEEVEKSSEIKEEKKSSEKSSKKKS